MLPIIVIPILICIVAPIIAIQATLLKQATRREVVERQVVTRTGPKRGQISSTPYPTCDGSVSAGSGVTSWAKYAGMNVRNQGVVSDGKGT